MKMNYPVLQGLGHDDVTDAFGPMSALPTTLMISRDGKICATHIRHDGEGNIRDRDQGAAVTRVYMMAAGC